MKRIVKGLVGVLLTALLISMTALAAPSNEAEGVVTDISAATDASGKDISSQLVVEELTAAVEAEVGEIRKEAELKEVLASAGVPFEEGMQVVDIQEVRVVGDVAFPVTITFQVTGVTPSSKVVMLHYKNGAWENIPATCGNGTVTGTFYSLSPVAFVVKNEASAPVKPGSGDKSPATGRTSFAWPVAVAAAAVFGMGVCLYMKKRELD